VADGRNAIIMGPVGAGKTFLATALGHAAIRRRHSVHFERAGHLLKPLKAARLDNSHDTEIRKLLRIDLLILDHHTPQPTDPPGPQGLAPLGPPGRPLRPRRTQASPKGGARPRRCSAPAPTTRLTSRLAGQPGPGPMPLADRPLLTRPRTSRNHQLQPR